MSKTNKLWIFRPHEKWTYCGGVIVICAESFERCQELMNGYAKAQAKEARCNKPFVDYKLEKIDKEPQNATDVCDSWVLHKVFLLADDLEEKVILVNYNDA